MKNKKSKQELTRLILTALILGSGCLYGTVAEATEVTVNSSSLPSGATTGGSGSNRFLTIENGAEDDILNIDYGGTHWQGYAFYGGYKYAPGQGAKNRTVNLISGSVKMVVGGWAGSPTGGGAAGGDANYNTVNITGGTITDSVYGGYAVYSNNASHNTITIGGSGTLNLEAADIYGGHPGQDSTVYKAEYNTININRSVTVKSLQGGTQTLSNNTLNIGATNVKAQKFNNIAGFVQGFDNINIGYVIKEGGQIKENHEINFSDSTTPVLSAAQFYSDPTVNITGLKNQSTDSGTMTLLSSGTANNFANYKVVYGTGANDYVQFSSTVTNKQISAGTTAGQTGGKGVTLNYKTDAKTLSLNSDATKIQYTIGNSAINSVDLGAMTWNDGYTAPSGFTFNNSTTINANNLTFTGSFNSNPVDQTTTLLSNANGIKDSTTAKTINLAASFQDANGIGYSGAATNGNVISSNTNKNITYKVTGATLDSLNLAGWNGSTSTLLSGWTNNSSGVNVTASFTNLPNIGTDVSRIIMTTNGKTGFFSDDKITGNNKYKTSGSIVDVPVAGVTLSGNTAGGVTTTNSGADLIYYATKNDVTGITLGSTTWGAKRDINNNAAYDFSGVTSIDASGLTFTGTATINGFTDSTNILTNAAGLTYAGTIIQPTNKTFNIKYTDDATKITYNGQATDGSVARDGTNLKYTISAGKVNEIDLGQWNGTAAPALPNTWDTPSGGVAVDTGDFESPTGTDNVDIFTTTEDGFFNENNITGDKKYKDNEPMPDDQQGGVTISGTKSGGIAPSEDGLTPTTSGKRLTYFAESTTGSKISLGEVAWTKAGTARALTGNYNFSNLVNNDVDATGLKFTFANSSDDTSVNKIAAGDTMTILAGATGLNSGLTVAGSPKSQAVSYGINNVANLSGTLTGNVTTTANTVNYEVTSKTLDSVDISNWDGTTSENLDASWTNNASGINVTGSGFTAPTTIGDTPILTTNVAGYFSNAQIADNIKYQPSGSYTETDKNITLSGSRGSGVKADDTNGSKLVYSIGAAFINNIKLGTVTYDTTGPWIDKSNINAYNFSTLTTLSSLDTALFAMSMTDAQKQSVAVGDTMTLVKGNNTLGNIAEKDAGASNYTYAPTTGMAVNGTVYGKVSASNNDVLYTVSDKKATTLDITKVTWGQTYSRSGSELDYQPAVVDSSNILFTGVSNLSTGDVMTLISNYGNGINKTRGGIFTLENGKTGKGTAYYEGGVLKYKVTLGAGEIQPAVSATNNKAILIIPDGQEHQGTVTGGEAKGDGDSTDNEQGVKGKIITNTDGTGGDVNGGTSEEGDSRRNKADVEDSTIEGDVNGGKSENGNSTDNEAEVDHSNVGGDVNGGKTDGDGETKGNEANVKNGSKVTGTVTGGRSGGNGDCTGNAAEVEGSEVGGDVNGGQSDGNGNTRENKTHVKDSKVTGNVIGGHSGQNDGSGGNGESTGNTAEVEGSEVGGNVNGGRSEQGNANKNESTVTGGSKVTGDVTGGSSGGGGTANENKTTVEGGSHIGGNVTGGESNGGNTNKNETTVSGSTVDKDVIGGKTSGNGTSNENKTNVNGSKVGGNVIGGQSENGNAEKNETTISGGSTIGGDVIGGKTTGTGNANENKVTLDGGSTVNGNIYGGYSQNGDASGNDVNIGTGKINGDIYGGFGSGNTTNNTITLSSGADVSNSNIFGGSNGSAGNTLNIGTSTEAWSGGGQSVKNISNFETLNFSSVPWNNSNAALNISDGSASDLSMTTIQAPQVAFSGVKRLSSGSTMMFLNQSNVNPATKRATNLVAGSAFTLGTAMEGSGRLTLDADGNVVYLIENASVSEQTHNTVMAAEAAVLSINSGNDFITSATEGLAKKENVGTDGLATYAKIGGQSMKQDTGSHVKVNTWNAILALGHKNTKKQSAFEYGAFVEHGWGNFATHNNGLRGDGSAEYTGGGLLAKWKTNNGTYVEGSFRAGTANEKANNLLRDAVQAYGYDERTSYAGFHIGVGKETVLKNGNLVDVYGKYFYNRKNGMNFNAGFDEYNIDAVTSQILRVGARYTVKSGSRWNYYGDLSYEHEFDGKATGRVNDMAIRGADISGGSLRMELVASLTPNDESPWEVDFNLTAYAGNKSGFTGGVSVKYAF